MSERPYVCSGCLYSYTRKAYFDNHFDNPRAKHGGDNPCYKAKKRIFGRSLEEAKNLQMTPSFSLLCGKKRPAEEKEAPIPLKKNEPTSGPSSEIYDESIHDIVHPQCIEPDEDLPIIDSDKVAFCGEEAQSLPKDSATLKNQNKIIDTQDKILKELKKLTDTRQDISIKTKIESVGDVEGAGPYLSRIRTANDMQTVLNSPLVANTFELKKSQNDDSNDYVLFCKCCAVPNSMSKRDILVKDPEYSPKKKTDGSFESQPNWFTNLKKAIIRHISKVSHEKNAHELALKQRFKTSAREEVSRCMRHLSYFAAKTSMPFSTFNYFLSTVNRCGVDLGNINHSEFYIRKYTQLLDQILKKNTVNWVKEKKDITITLDIGTCQGLTLLAVLLIKDSEVHLMKIVPTSCKKGPHLAELCVDALTSKELGIELLKEKIVGVVGDGAFMKGNEGFKSKMRELLHENLTFRWDILHLCNRAHADARGRTAAEAKDEEREHEEDGENIESDNLDKVNDHLATPISKLIDLIQKSAKKLRTGICYTGLRLSIKSFKRPKVWSATRMCLYEFDMVERFLENREFFDMQGQFVVLAILYCLPMFCLKIFLKCCQKTTVTSEYVQNTITTGGSGKKTMLFCLQVAKTKLLFGSPCMNTHHIDSKCDSLCISHKEEGLDKFPDILSSNGREVNTKDNNFLKELSEFVERKKQALSMPSDLRQMFRTTRSTTEKDLKDIIEEESESVKLFIIRFWDAIDRRLKFTDLDAGATCYSEAPAEGVFSVIERILNDRENINLDALESQTRVSLEGPGVATMDGYNLSKEALKLWDKGKGERFTTEHWIPGLKQKSMIQIQEGQGFRKK